MTFVIHAAFSVALLATVAACSGSSSGTPQSSATSTPPQPISAPSAPSANAVVKAIAADPLAGGQDQPASTTPVLPTPVLPAPGFTGPVMPTPPTAPLGTLVVAPSGLTYAATSYTYTTNAAVLGDTPKSGGGTPTSFSVSPALPRGLSLDATTGVISGTPTTYSVAVSYLVTATNTGGTATTNLSIGVNPAPGTIVTIAGGGPTVDQGDGGLAVMATLNRPGGVAIDSSGNIYIVSTASNRIRKVTTDGIISAVAGSGAESYSGDGGLATVASLNHPRAVAIDSGGNLYIADTSNNCIRKVKSNGIITTVAGTGKPGFSGDGDLATSATLSFPTGVAVDSSGNLYISDFNNSRIRKVTIDGRISTWAGNATAGFSGDGGLATSASLFGPTGIALDSTGNLFIADSDNRRIRMVTPGGIITTVAGGSTRAAAGSTNLATSLSLNNPTGVAIDANGNLYIDDQGNNFIRKVSPDGKASTVAGNFYLSYSTTEGSLATYSYLNTPTGVAVDSTGNVYISDSGFNKIRMVAPMPPAGLSYSPAVTYTAGSVITENSPTSSGGMVVSYSVSPDLPAGLAINKVTGAIAGTPTAASGEAIYTVTAANSNGSTTTLLSITVNYAGTQSAPPSRSSGTGISPPSSLNYAASTYVYFTDAAVLGDQPTSGGGKIAFLSILPALPAGLSLNAETGRISGTPVAISAATNYVVTAINAGGIATAIFSMTVNPGPGTIQTIAGNGAGTFSGDAHPATIASLNSPFGVAIDASGNVYVADSLNNRIRKFQTNGTIVTVAGNGTGTFSGDGLQATNASLNNPKGVALDTSGNLFIADSANGRIRKVTTDGIISTVAGGGKASLLGISDGVPAVSAFLGTFSGVAVDAGGNIYIATLDTAYRIRKVTTDGIITTFAGGDKYGFSGDGGQAKNAWLYGATGVAFDSFGNVYIADTFNNRVRKVTTNGIISTVAGNGTNRFSGDGGLAVSASLNSPTSVAVDQGGNLYIADAYNNSIRKVAPSGLISTVAGYGRNYGDFSGDGGQATKADLNYPSGVAVDSTGNLYIADFGNNRVRMVTPSGN